jgi:release factor glutamine methyltransferase
LFIYLYLGFIYKNPFMSTKQKFWKLIDLLNTTSDYFKAKNIENPRLNAELLLGHVLKMKRVNLYVEFERIISNTELSTYRELVSRRITHEPLQYIIGQTEFMGLPFNVNPSVLIPRPETEILCETVLALKDGLTNPVSVLDIGTGSGCLAVSLAHFWPGAKVSGIDINEKTLEAARSNAKLNKTDNAFFFNSDIFNWPDLEMQQEYSVVVSNPPYIKKDEMTTLQPEVKDFEPAEALTDFADGMKFYSHFFTLVEQGLLKCTYFVLEMSGLQPEKIVDEAKSRKFGNIEVIKDLTGIDRVLKIKV